MTFTLAKTLRDAYEDLIAGARRGGMSSCAACESE
jgi:hypothetical protein